MKETLKLNDANYPFLDQIMLVIFNKIMVEIDFDAMSLKSWITY
ncbi:hypothetical protein [Methanobrevibacter sp.]